MVIITHVIYPSEGARAMAERFLDAPELPDYMTKKGPYVTSNLEGILLTSLYEFENERLADGFKFLGDYMAIYFGVPGFSFEIIPYFEIKEGLSMIGM
jgi:hypothetical protein